MVSDVSGTQLTVYGMMREKRRRIWSVEEESDYRDERARNMYLSHVLI